MILPAVNFHINRSCNARCHFCFATFEDVPGQLSTPDALRIIDALSDAGVEKLNFAGGEPTLHRGLGALVGHARVRGFVTSVVTNGARLGALLEAHARDLDWVGLSVDSGSEATEVALGRGTGRYVASAVALADRCRAEGVRVKLNTVVTALNADERLHELVRRVRPERWKVFQVLPMAGQNDGRVEPLLISREAFQRFLDAHADLADEDLAPVGEDNDAMRGSYLMIDPEGRLFDNAEGRHRYSDPVLSVGLKAALAQVGCDLGRFEARGGRYAW